MLENGSRGVTEKQLVAGAAACSHGEQVVAGLLRMCEDGLVRRHIGRTAVFTLTP
jgi:hypothetical protein